MLCAHLTLLWWNIIVMTLQEFQIEMKSTSTVKCFHIHLLVQSVDSLANVVIPILQRRKLRLGENV